MIKTEIDFPDKPSFSEDQVVYDFLATVKISESDLRNACVRKATIVSSDADGTFTIDIDGWGEESGVPIFYHTDRGARGKKAKGTIANDPSDYFAGSEFLFPMKETGFIKPIEFEILYDEKPATGGTAVRAATVMVVVHLLEGVLTPIGIIDIIDNGVCDVGFDRREFAFPTYTPYIMLKERGSATPVDGAFTLFDLITGDIAHVPNSDNTSLISARGITALDVPSTFFDGGFEEVPIVPIEAGCSVLAWTGSEPTATGEKLSGGACSCNDYDDSIYTWECTSFTNASIYTTEGLCSSGAIQIKNGSSYYYEIPIGHKFGWGIDQERGLNGYSVISWANRIRVDIFNHRELDTYDGSTLVTEQGIELNEEEHVYAGTTWEHVLNEERIVFESSTSMYFSFSYVASFIREYGWINDPTPGESLYDEIILGDINVVHDDEIPSWFNSQLLPDVIEARLRELAYVPLLSEYRYQNVAHIIPAVVFLPYNIQKDLI